jgi:hypothetical protein
MSQVTLGGDRLGAGNKQKVSLHNYERSTHDLGYTWRSTMASGTLVPFMTELGLPGDTFDIDLNLDVMTHPTIGPLFGSYKVQLDVFACPIRLYNGKLHMNMLNIGLDMAKVKLPQVKIKSNVVTEIGDNTQINPSSIFSYLNIRGLGKGGSEYAERDFNAIPYLAYFDIYKQYYANKQEEIGAIIHNPMNYIVNSVVTCYLVEPSVDEILLEEGKENTAQSFTLSNAGRAQITFNESERPDVKKINLYYEINVGTNEDPVYEIHGGRLDLLFGTITWDSGTKVLTATYPIDYIHNQNWVGYEYNGAIDKPNNVPPQITTFPLTNIDEMREDILIDVKSSSAFQINQSTIEPYNLPLQAGNYDPEKWSVLASQEGLLLKTYQSDLFNNWISTEWIDGDTGINAITAIDTSSGEFTIDTLQLSKKVYDMLNRIAVSGGTYDDWLNASYTHERTRGQENPAYVGGLIKELAFQEVVSTASGTLDNVGQPLGTLAGRGVLTNKHKGGTIKVKIDEPSYVIGIVSLTPRVDYSQGNKWDVNLKTMADFHQPALDEIGFQDLITDQMAWFDTELVAGQPVFKSAGKQPAWINYMTNVNQVRGNFAEENEQMWMTLNRRYEQSENGIEDLTTYIDPSKFNHIFADTRLDAQNFWVQIAVQNTARRKMSAKLMPNL